MAGLATNILIPSAAASLWDMQNCREDPNKFLCHDGECIDRIKKCDGQKHCSDESDESDCGTFLFAHFICGLLFLNSYHLLVNMDYVHSLIIDTYFLHYTTILKKLLYLAYFSNMPKQ